jgi:poly(A) polymerase Pap1
VARSIDLQNNNLLRGMDDVSVRCINGCRVTDKILLLVHQKSGDCVAFRTALRFLKVPLSDAPVIALCLSRVTSHTGSGGPPPDAQAPSYS